jgi:uDENN domain
VYDEKHRDNIVDETSHSSNDSTQSPVLRGVSRSLTEKRKKYVRRTTQISISFDNEEKPSPASYGSLRDVPSAASKIMQFQGIIDKFKDSLKVEKKSGESLFSIALLVGFDVTKMSAYIKSSFPKTAKVPPMIEQFIYPTDKTPSDLMTKENQNFTLILTDEYGGHLFGYCRQVVPEGFEICLPLTYCLISNVKASGFFFNVLKEIEARHGQPEAHINHMLRQIQTQQVPTNGKFLHVKLMDNKRLSLESPEWLKGETSQELSRSPIDLDLINRSLLDKEKRVDEILIKRPNDLRLENGELSVLYESTTSELLVIIFGTLLIERKVILVGRNIKDFVLHYGTLLDSVPVSGKHILEASKHLTNFLFSFKVATYYNYYHA